MAIAAAGRVRPTVAALALAVSLCVLRPSLAQEDRPDDYLDAHNAARAEVGVGPLTWDDDLAAYAQQYAYERAGDCELVHSDGPYGENIFWGWGTHYTASYAVNSWVEEKQDYDYESNSCNVDKVCGHYTQVVWADTRRVGCGRVQCDNDGGDYIVCSYDPPGNIEDQWPYVISA